TVGINWTLRTQAVPPVLVASSAIPVRILDSFNVPDLQFYSADVSRIAMEQRLVEVITEVVYLRVSEELRRRLEARTAAT
ncbi:MAG TPA: hypothetical protein VE684_06960, partial [Crenalkalicoccus sp.]|nr:hypothetical protein [Crenalkalicoccus sp.]